MTFEIAMKIAHKMMKKLIVTGLIIVLSMLIMQFNQTLGILLMMVYSSWMMLKSSKNEMPLSKFTAILPGAMALLCFLFIMGFMGVYRPIMPIAGIVIGIIPGFLKARAHRIYNKDGKVYAQKTYFYILIWTGSLLFTQGSTLLGLRQIIEFGFLLNGFSTTMAVILSVFLFKKAKSLQGPKISANRTINGLLLMVAALLFMALSIQPVEAYTVEGPMTVKKMDQIGKYVFQEALLRTYAGAKLSTGSGRYTSNDKAYKFTGKFSTGKIPLFYHYPDTSNNYGKLSGKPKMGAESIYYEIHYKGKKSVESQLKEYVRLSKRDIVGQPTKDYYYYGHLLALDYNSLNTDDGERGLYFIKTTQDRKWFDKRDRKVSMNVIWIYKDWTFKIHYFGYPDNPKTLLGRNCKNYILNVTARARQRIKSLQVVPPASKPKPKPKPKPEPQPKPQPPVNTQTNQEDTKDDTDTSKPDQDTEELASAIDKVLSAIEQSLQNFGFYGGAVAAGVAVALVQLLAGLGMNVATTAAYEVAFAVEGSINEGLQENDPNPKNEDTDDDSSQSDRDTLIDENGERWESNDDGLFGVESDDGDIEWMTREEAEKSIQEELDGRRRREQESDELWDDIQDSRDEYYENQKEQLKEDGYEYDEKQDAWIKGPEETRSDLEEFYDRVDYLEKHKHEFTDEMNETIQNVLDRTGYKDHTIDAEKFNAPKDKSLETIKRLNNAVFNLEAADNDRNFNFWQKNSDDIKNLDDVRANIETVGSTALSAVELYATNGKSKGAITSAIFEVAKNRDKSGIEIITNSTLNAAETYLGNTVGGLSNSDSGKAAVNALWGSSVEAGKQAWAGEGFDQEKILTAGVRNAVKDKIKNVIGSKIKGEQAAIALLAGNSSEQLSKDFTDGAFVKFAELTERLGNVIID